MNLTDQVLNITVLPLGIQYPLYTSGDVDSCATPRDPEQEVTKA